MGFSREGLLTLLVGVERRDLKALLILAPAPGRGLFAEAVFRVASLNPPVLLLVEPGDRSLILEDFEMLERALRAHEKRCGPFVTTVEADTDSSGRWVTTGKT